MSTSTVLFLLLVLACPLAMAWMMRGGHGHGHGHAAGNGDGPQASEASIDELRRQRAELDRLIDEHEQTARELCLRVRHRLLRVRNVETQDLPEDRRSEIAVRQHVIGSERIRDVADERCTRRTRLANRVCNRSSRIAGCASTTS